VRALVTLAAFTLVPVATGLDDAVLRGCWVSVIATAARVILSAGTPFVGRSRIYVKRWRLGVCSGRVRRPPPPP